MNVTPETVAAVNDALRHLECGIHDEGYDDPWGYVEELDAEQVAELLLALAACEPVRGLVEAVDSAKRHHERAVESALAAGKAIHLHYIEKYAAALAPFAEVQA